MRRQSAGAQGGHDGGRYGHHPHAADNRRGHAGTGQAGDEPPFREQIGGRHLAARHDRESGERSGRAECKRARR